MFASIRKNHKRGTVSLVVAKEQKGDTFVPVQEAKVRASVPKSHAYLLEYLDSDTGTMKIGQNNRAFERIAKACKLYTKAQNMGAKDAPKAPAKVKAAPKAKAPAKAKPAPKRKKAKDQPAPVAVAASMDKEALFEVFSAMVDAHFSGSVKA